MLASTRLMKINHSHFYPFRNHSAIRSARQLLERSGTDFFLLALYYEQLPTVKRALEISDTILQDINEDRKLALKELDELMALVADFYEESNYQYFQEKYSFVYTQAVEEVLQSLPSKGTLDFMEKYFGGGFVSYKFYVVPFFKSEFGMSYTLKTELGTENITLISPFQPAKLDNNDSILSVGYKSPEDAFQWTVHEYAHSFFNESLYQKDNQTDLEKFAGLYKPVEAQPQYTDWANVFAEHLALAFEVRAVQLLDSEAAAEKLRKKYQDWYYLDHFIEQLKYYETHRDKYPNIASFIPDLIASGEQIVE
jgi:hypothetical protein